ncbi:glucokinase [Enterococcus florum]|uniref:Glucokinase n=1 Tax=Enterococcus florum TaxID=2480627 RepID=A0A4P5PGD5_9ENTE|nr:glucokinase [Enterococcus florum]
MTNTVNNMIGIDIGGTSIKFSLMDKNGAIEKKWSIPTNISEKGMFIPKEICESIQTQVLNNEAYMIDGIGIGVPGPISTDGRVVLQAVNLDWYDLPLKDLIENELGIGVALLNDANAAALGEMWQGAARGKENLLFVTLGTGVGGGIVLNGQILNGCHSAGGEIGHIPVRSTENRLCGCGARNCLETFSSANGLTLSMRKKLEEVGESWASLSAPRIFSEAEKGNPLAQEVLAEFIDILGQALAGILNTIDVEQVIVGGGLSAAGDQLLKPLKASMDRYVFPQIKHHFSLKKAQLENEAGSYGAVYAYLSMNDLN